MASRTLTVTLGEQSFSPVPYNSFRVGPFSLTVEVEGDLYETNANLANQEAYKTAMASLLEMQERAYRDGLALFLENRKKAEEEARRFFPRLLVNPG